MDNLFGIRVLTAAVNMIKKPGGRIFQRFFAGKMHMLPTDKLAFDVISGSEGILGNISVIAPATVTAKTGRKTITLQAPRLAEKRIVHAAELNAMRAYGQQFAAEQMKTRINRELMDMRNKVDRTLEFWAARALSGQILDSDLITVLVDYNLPATHKITLTGNDLWTDISNSKPLEKLREFKKLIEDDSGSVISDWVSFHGSDVGDALLGHTKVLDLMKYNKGVEIAQTGRISRLVEIELNEYNASFVDNSAVRQRFIPSDIFCLVGIAPDTFDCPYAPILDTEAPGSVGNTVGGKPAPFFSKSWEEKDPSGRWIKTEVRPLPVLQRVGAVIWAKVV